MVTDDSVKTRAKLIDILRCFAEFSEIYESSNGWEAIEAFKQKPVDVVIIDIVMPIMDGIQTLKELKSLDPGLLVVVISSLHQKEILYQSLESGADQYILKPLEFDVIQSTLENVLGRSLTLTCKPITNG